MEVALIARIWHGMTETSRADEYLRFLRMRSIPDYKSVPGNEGAFVFRRIEGDRAHFMTISFWSSIDAVRRFAGDDIDKAKYYPEDSQFLLEFEPSVTHFEAYSNES
jgi:heme-degrading monooxygenase HmoA